MKYIYIYIHVSATTEAMGMGWVGKTEEGDMWSCVKNFKEYKITF